MNENEKWKVEVNIGLDFLDYLVFKHAWFSFKLYNFILSWKKKEENGNAHTYDADTSLRGVCLEPAVKGRFRLLEADN